MLGFRRKRVRSLVLGRTTSQTTEENYLSRPGTLARITAWLSQRKRSGIFKPNVYHALVVIFLEFFSWGLLMSPIITVLDETFGQNAFLMNGLIQGIKGLLSFLSAPLIGALSDTWGRKPFLLLTVTFTCAPIPLMKFSPMWYFAITSISGIFSVTFSIVFAYVADVTTKEERSAAYGLVSATFAASLVTSPAIGAYLGGLYGDNLVVALASAVALLDILFILVAVPESLTCATTGVSPELQLSKISWEKADPFSSLKVIGKDRLILMLSVTVFLSYLPEAGEYSSFFVYLRLVIDFTPEKVAAFVAMIGVLSCLAQTAFLAILMRQLGNKKTVIVGLAFEMVQLFMIGFFSQQWLLWAAGAVAAMGSITYPAISVFVSAHASPEQQGVAQGVITGIRGLCNGLGPALFGFIFYLFGVDLGKMPSSMPAPNRPGDPGLTNITSSTVHSLGSGASDIVPGPPFMCGGILVIIAMLVAVFMPQYPSSLSRGPETLEIELPAAELCVTRRQEKEPLMLSEEEST